MAKINEVVVETTISDVEDGIEAALEDIRTAQLGVSARISFAIKYLAPSGYSPIIELQQQDGRKKRRDADASNWSPDSGRILIYFERDEDAAFGAPTSSSPLISTQPVVSFPAAPIMQPPASKSVEPASDVVSVAQIEEVCAALADAERAGKSFIALKWFRDDALVTHGYPWVGTPEIRQAVLAKAIEVGAVVTNKIPNPKAPMHPTTTIRLNRDSAYAKAVPSRFNPVRAVDGASASAIILQDRGRY